MTVQRWAPDAAPWSPPVQFDAKVKALEGCWEPCALALRTRVNGASNDGRVTRLGAALDRCLYECKGTEQAPARTEPTDAH